MIITGKFNMHSVLKSQRSENTAETTSLGQINQTTSFCT